MKKKIWGILTVACGLFISSLGKADSCSDKYGAGYYNGGVVNNISAGPGQDSAHDKNCHFLLRPRNAHEMKKVVSSSFRAKL